MKTTKMGSMGEKSQGTYYDHMWTLLSAVSPEDWAETRIGFYETYPQHVKGPNLFQRFYNTLPRSNHVFDYITMLLGHQGRKDFRDGPATPVADIPRMGSLQLTPAILIYAFGLLAKTTEISQASEELVTRVMSRKGKVRQASDQEDKEGTDLFVAWHSGANLRIQVKFPAYSADPYNVFHSGSLKFSLGGTATHYAFVRTMDGNGYVDYKRTNLMETDFFVIRKDRIRQRTETSHSILPGPDGRETNVAYYNKNSGTFDVVPFSMVAEKWKAPQHESRNL